jgi:hypothetical protein
MITAPGGATANIVTAAVLLELEPPVQVADTVDVFDGRVLS